MANGQIQEWAVVPESNRIATIRIFCDMEFNERDCSREDNHKAVTLWQPGTEKTAAAPKKVLQPISRNKSHHIPYLQAWRKVTSHEQFSWLAFQRFNQAFSGFPND